MNQTLRRLERVMTVGITAGMDIGGGGEGPESEFVSEPFDFVVRELNGGRVCEAVTLNALNMQYSAMGQTICDERKATAVKLLAKSRFYFRFKEMKLMWKGYPDLFNEMIQVMLKGKIDSVHIKMNRMAAEGMKADGSNRDTYRGIIYSLTTNNARFRFFFCKKMCC